MEAVDPVKLREIIREEISKNEVDLEIKRLLDQSEDFFSENGDDQPAAGNRSARHELDRQKIAKLLRTSGLSDKVLANILKRKDEAASRGNGSITTGRSSTRPPPDIDMKGCYLHVELIQGHAFIEHIIDKDERFMRSHHSSQPTSTMGFHLSFGSQRWHSKWVVCSSDPIIQESTYFQLVKETATQVNLASLLTQSQSNQIHLVIVTRDVEHGDNRLVTSHYLDWRVVLNAPGGVTKLNLELKGVGPEAKVSIGVVECRLSLLPRPVTVLAEDLVSGQVGLEKSRFAERERIFLVYAKQWWKEYLQIRDSHSQRLVKIFANDENGENRFVCSYIQPLMGGRILENPRQAARFVSTIPFERLSILGLGPKEQWTTIHAFLARGKGDVEEHACLLCSLLLGFGLDAYVAVGTRVTVDSPYAWVVTLQNGIDSESAVFWDAVYGKRYVHRPFRPERFPEELPPSRQELAKIPFRTISCLFNHERFYANNQPTDAVETCVFTLRDESRWKALSQDAIASIRELEQQNVALSAAVSYLRPSQVDVLGLSQDLEMELRHLVTQWRRDQAPPPTTGKNRQPQRPNSSHSGGLTTRWNEHLSHLLTQALSAYELEQLLGVSMSAGDSGAGGTRETFSVVGNEEFQSAVRLAVPEGHTFKAYPIQVLHTNARRAFASAMKSPICQDIVNCRGDLLQMAVRVRVYSYAETATATWIMFACTYKSVP